MSANNSDIALWNAFKDGDSQSFDLLFRRFYGPLLQYGNKLVKDEDLLEDCVQELFTEIWQSKSRTEVASVKAYLFKSLKYKLFRAIQKNHKGQNNKEPADMLFELSHETILVKKEEGEETSTRIVHALKQLTERQKEIIYLKYYQELSYEEISEIMSINYQAARNLLYQAIKSLKKVMAGVIILSLVV